MSLGCAGGELELDCEYQGWCLEWIVRGMAGGCGVDAGGGGGGGGGFKLFYKTKRE